MFAKWPFGLRLISVLLLIVTNVIQASQNFYVDPNKVSEEVTQG